MLQMMNELRRLHLDENTITVLPESICDLTSLFQLTLKGNQLTALPEDLGNLVNLRLLDLSMNEISSLPASLAGIPCLRHFLLRNNQITSIARTCDHLGEAGSAEEELKGKAEEEPGAAAAAADEGVAIPPSVEFLDLQDNKLERLPSCFTELKRLSLLRMAKNSLSALPDRFGALQQLKEIDFSHNRLESLPASIADLSNLQVLSLAMNNLKTVPESLCQLVSLTAVDLEGNAICSLPSCIGELSNLRTLSVASNKLKSIPENFGLLTNLGRLDMSDNPVDALPASFVALRNLNHWILFDTPIGRSPYYTTPIIVKLPKLRTVVLEQGKPYHVRRWRNQIILSSNQQQRSGGEMEAATSDRPAFSRKRSTSGSSMSKLVKSPPKKLFVNIRGTKKDRKEGSGDPASPASQADDQPPAGGSADAVRRDLFSDAADEAPSDTEEGKIPTGGIVQDPERRGTAGGGRIKKKRSKSSKDSTARLFQGPDGVDAAPERGPSTPSGSRKRGPKKKSSKKGSGKRGSHMKKGEDESPRAKSEEIQLGLPLPHKMGGSNDEQSGGEMDAPGTGGGGGPVTSEDKADVSLRPGSDGGAPLEQRVGMDHAGEASGPALGGATGGSAEVAAGAVTLAEPGRAAEPDAVAGAEEPRAVAEEVSPAEEDRANTSAEVERIRVLEELEQGAATLQPEAAVDDKEALLKSLGVFSDSLEVPSSEMPGRRGPRMSMVIDGELQDLFGAGDLDMDLLANFEPQPEAGSTEKLFQEYGEAASLNKAGLRRGKKEPTRIKGKATFVMEDRHIVTPELGGDVGKSLFCVFDGHAGPAAAEECVSVVPDVFLRLLYEHGEDETDYGEVLHKTFVQSDQELSREKCEYQGCTATACYLWRASDGERRVQVANVGDSYAFLYIGDEVVAVTEQHGLEVSAERDRIRAMGVELYDGQTRLAGLKVTRALGDLFTKQIDSGVIAEPYVSPPHVVPNGEECYLVVASDGLWDVISGKRALTIIKGNSDYTAQKHAECLLKTAVGSSKCHDNTTVIVVKL